MNIVRRVFAQIINFVPSFQLQQCVDPYNGSYKMINLTCREQLLYMSFAQLTYHQSPRDIKACLGVAKSKMYHLGIRSIRVTKQSAPCQRDPRLKDLCRLQALNIVVRDQVRSNIIRRHRKPARHPLGLRLHSKLLHSGW